MAGLRSGRALPRCDATVVGDGAYTVLGDGAYINTRLVVPHRRGPGRALLKGEEEDNAAHRRSDKPSLPFQGA